MFITQLQTAAAKKYTIQLLTLQPLLLAALITYDEIPRSWQSTIDSEQVEEEEDECGDEGGHGDELNPPAAVISPRVPYDGTDECQQSQNLSHAEFFFSHFM